MNSYERFKKRLQGEKVDRPPNFDIVMTFAAHYINQPLSRYYADYRVLVEANLAMLEDFELDIVQAISDPYRETADFGAEIEFPADNLPLCRQPLLADPAHLWVEELLAICAEVSVAFARAQVEAGADIIGIGDAIASQISPEMYRRFALPYEKRVFDAVHELGALGRLHICGNTTHLLELMPESGADIIDLDWMVDWPKAGALFGDRLPLCGNFDPVAIMLQGTPQEVYRATLDCLETGGRLNISGAGCEIPDNTPPKNLQAQTRALKDFGAS
jgi:uroporphyrinogen-III decarboxylase